MNNFARSLTLSQKVVSVAMLSLAKIALLMTALAVFAASLFAEPPGKTEVSVLYSFLKPDTSHKQDFTRAEPSWGAHGSKTELYVFLNKNVGLGGSVSSSQDDLADLLGGPEFAVLDRGRVDLRLFTRAGSAVRSYQGNFATSVGSSVNFYVGHRIAVRVQPEVLWWWNQGAQTDFRTSIGVVSRFGRAK